MQPGSIAIMHHHLYPGGVARIIDSQVKSLTDQYPGLKIRVICGYTDQTDRYQKQGVQMMVNEDLNYLYDENPPAEKILDFTRRITHYLRKVLGDHDFAKDRPANMAFLEYILRDGLGLNPQEILYPRDMENYHFAVINTYDQQRLLNQGIPPHRVTYLPNPVSMPETESLPSTEACRKKITDTLNLDPRQKIVTYPVRVIRRKNIGELIFLSELFRDQAVFLVTLAPKNPLEYEHYNQWIAFCQENQLNNIHFEVGKVIDFPELVKGSDLCITTSLREGFGMTYMEPWLYRTPVVGRKIDYITRDFLNKGLTFNRLYESIILPGQNVDFKDLETKDQMYEILKARHNPARKKEIFAHNTPLKELLKEVDKNTIEANIKRIIQHYSPESYGKKIMETYHGLPG